MTTIFRISSLDSCSNVIMLIDGAKDGVTTREIYTLATEHFDFREMNIALCKRMLWWFIYRRKLMNYGSSKLFSFYLDRVLHLLDPLMNSTSFSWNCCAEWCMVLFIISEIGPAIMVKGKTIVKHQPLKKQSKVVFIRFIEAWSVWLCCHTSRVIQSLHSFAYELCSSPRRRLLDEAFPMKNASLLVQSSHGSTGSPTVSSLSFS